MALSNWASVAFDKNGKLSESKIELIEDKKEKILEVYKNWIRVGDKSMWKNKKHGDFSSPWVSFIQYGNLILSGFEIVSKRDRQSGVFCFVRYCTYNKKDIMKEYYFAAIGCSAFSNHKDVGIEQKTFKNFKDWLRKLPDLKNNGIYLDEVSYKKWLNKILRLKKSHSYNQGTLYLAKHGVDLNKI